MPRLTSVLDFMRHDATDCSPTPQQLSPSLQFGALYGFLQGLAFYLRWLFPLKAAPRRPFAGSGAAFISIDKLLFMSQGEMSNGVPHGKLHVRRSRLDIFGRNHPQSGL